MQRIAIIYSSVDGQTKKICRFLEAELKKQFLRPEVFSVEQFQMKVSEYDAIVLGASVRYGKHNPKVKKFIAENREVLAQVHTAFFSVNLVARNNEKNTPQTNPYYKKFVEEVHWEAQLSAVFAGKLDYSKYSFWDKLMIKIIMKMTHGPTKATSAIEYTDWNKVSAFGKKIATQLQPPK